MGNERLRSVYFDDNLACMKQVKKRAVQLPFTRQTIAPIARRHGISTLGVFGSYARGEARKASDVDLLVTFKKRKTFFDLAKIQEDLEGAIGKRVDLLTPGALSPYMRDGILRDLRPVL